MYDSCQNSSKTPLLIYRIYVQVVFGPEDDFRRNSAPFSFVMFSCKIQDALCVFSAWKVLVLLFLLERNDPRHSLMQCLNIFAFYSFLWMTNINDGSVNGQVEKGH